MAAERDLELLDDYLANRLDPQSRSAFEQKISKDPSLKGELELQKQFIQGIQKARVTELKSFMNSIPVPPASTGAAVAGKIAAAIIIAGAVGTGLYFAFQAEKDIQKDNPQIQQDSEAVEPEYIPENQQVVSPETEESPEVPSEKSATESAPVVAPKSIKKDKSQQVPADPKVEVYDPTQEENEPVENVDNLGIPRPEATPALSVEVKTDKKLDFHYQFVDGQLVLYGPFEKNLYEIMEFFNAEKQTTFLVHKEQFYHLKNEGDQVKPLVPIKDQVLIKKLKEYRAQ